MKHRGETSVTEIDIEVRRVVRRWRIVGGSAAVIVGIIGLAWPESALKSIALIFGVYLVVVGVLRVSSALSDLPPSGWRVGQLAFGALVVLAGVLCLNNPFGSLAALTLIIGLGWIIDGVAAIVTSLIGTRAERWWTIVLAGGISIVAGVILIVTPYTAFRPFLFIGSSLLIVIGAVTLVTLVPRKAPRDNSQ